MPKYRVNVSWIEVSSVEIVTENEEEARADARDLELSDALETASEYLSGSFAVDGVDLLES